MKNRLMGLALIVIALVLATLIISFTTQLQAHAVASCSCVAKGEECTMQQGLPWQSYIGFPFVLALIVLGIYLLARKDIKEGIKLKTNKKIINQLDKEEKKIYQMVIGAEGTIFQSELVEKSGFSKVKVTRILDKLEGKQIIERKRRGMTNVVILK